MGGVVEVAGDGVAVDGDAALSYVQWFDGFIVGLGVDRSEASSRAFQSRRVDCHQRLKT